MDHPKPDRGWPRWFPLNYWLFLVVVCLSFPAAGAYFGGLPLAMIGMVIGIVAGLVIIACWAADDDSGRDLGKAGCRADSPEAKRARFGRLASWCGWSFFAFFVFLAILDNVGEVDGVHPLEGFACLGTLVALIVAWVIFKALSLPD